MRIEELGEDGLLIFSHSQKILWENLSFVSRPKSSITLAVDKAKQSSYLKLVIGHISHCPSFTEEYTLQNI